jgi:hypothetical protein
MAASSSEIFRISTGVLKYAPTPIPLYGDNLIVSPLPGSSFYGGGAL